MPHGKVYRNGDNPILLHIYNICSQSTFFDYQMKFFFKVFLLLSTNAIAQIGGDNTYEFLNLPVSARETAMGSNLITIMDNDINLAYRNPASINSKLDKDVSFNTAIHFSGLTAGYAGLAKTHKNIGTLNYGIQFISYGAFQQTNPDGTKTGSVFQASEYALNAGWGQNYNEYLSYGINAKLITSFLESYFSLGAAIDIAGTYHNKESDLVVTGIIKNIGTQIKAYTPENKEELPFEIQMGVSKKLEHLPFRFSIVAHNMHIFNIRYDDPNIVQQSSLFLSDTSQSAKEKKYIGDKILRHFIFGGELLLGQNLSIRIGYNHLKRREMTIESRNALTGFSWGFGMKIKKIRIEYGSASYHFARGFNHLSISSNLNEFF